MRRVIANIILMMLLAAGWLSGQGQTHESFRLIPEGKKAVTLPLELSQNLIIIPVQINEGKPMRFVLDTGISNTIVTELAGSDTLSLRFARQILITGLGDGLPVEGWFSSGNRVVIGATEMENGSLVCDSSSIYALTEDQFQLSRQLGYRVNGLIGSGLFNQFLIRIDPEAKTVTIYDRRQANLQRMTRHFKQVPLILNGGKAYVDVVLTQDNGSTLTVRLLIDTGASLSFWISPKADTLIRIPSQTMRAFLGQGLNGEIKGLIGRIRTAQLGPFVFKNPLVSYPDEQSIGEITLNNNRHGSMGNDILRRFTVILDYAGKCLYLKPNRSFNTSFTFNRSGMEVEKPVHALPIYMVYSVIEGSPAYQAGLREGDLLEYINYNPVLNLTLDDIYNILHGGEGKNITIRINRNGESLRFRFSLRDKLILSD